MKKIKTLGLFAFLTFFACTTDDNNPDIDNENSSTVYFEDVVNKEFKTEGIYFLAGAGNNSIKTDNPTVSNLPRSGKSFFSNLPNNGNPTSIDVNTVPFILIAGQTSNENKDVMDIPNLSDFGYNILTMVRATDAPGLLPNIRIEPLETLTFSPNGIQGQDINLQTILDLDNGKFKITALVAGVLGFTSDGSTVQSVIYEITPPQGNNDAFPRTADGVITSKIDPNLLDDIQIQDLIQEVFNNGIVEVCLFEIVDGNPNVDSNPNISGQQATTTRHYGLPN